MVEYNLPMFSEVKEDDIVVEARNIFDTYADAAQVEPFTGEDSIRNAVRLSKDNPYKDAMLSEDDFVELERRTGLFTYLRKDDNGAGKSNIEYMSTYKKCFSKKGKSEIDSFHASLMAEKEEEEREYYESIGEYDKYKPCCVDSSDNIDLDEIDELK